MKDPIVLTIGGDILTHYPGDFGEDAETLGPVPGVHLICGGFIDYRSTNAVANTLICRECHLRVEVPCTVEMVADLRRYLHAFQPPSSDWNLPPVGQRIVCVRSHGPFAKSDCATVVERPQDVRLYRLAVRFDSAAIHAAADRCGEPILLPAGSVGYHGGFIIHKDDTGHTTWG